MPSTPPTYTFIAGAPGQPATHRGMRLDKYVAACVPELSRSRIQALIKDGCILVDGAAAKPKDPVAEGCSVTVTIPPPRPADALPQALPISVLYADKDLVVIDKQCGMVVHPASGNPDGTLVNALLHHFGELSAVGGVSRPGIVHRLDKETSGCLVVARNDVAHESLTNQFSGRLVSKQYLAVVTGVPSPRSGTIESRIGRNPRNRQTMAVVYAPAGKAATTDYEVVNVVGETALARCDLHTGRTHQIRVHLKHIGHPILGDPVYGKRPSKTTPRPGRLMLHAWKLGFTHPVTGEHLHFEAPVPAEFTPWTSGTCITESTNPNTRGG